MVRCCIPAEVDLDMVAKLTGLDKKYIQACLTNKAMKIPPHLFTRGKRYNPKVSRSRADTPQASIVEDFFMGKTYKSSGSRTETREMRLTLTELKVAWYAEYPSYLRKHIATYPGTWDITQEKIARKEKLSRFDRSLLEAVRLSEEEVFSEEAEIIERTKEASTVYNLSLERKRLKALGLNVSASASRRKDEDTKEAIKAVNEMDDYELKQISETMDGFNDDEESEEDEEEDNNKSFEIRPLSQRTFWKTLAQKRIHWTRNVNPTECPIHDQGPKDIQELPNLEKKTMVMLRELKDVRAEISTILRKDNQASVQKLRSREAELAPLVLQAGAKERELRDNIQHYHDHCKQFEICRKIIQNITTNLVPGECVMYRDFVAMYNCEGEKIQNLVLVAMWRDKPNDPIRVFKFNNYCADKNSRASDGYYVADVMDFFAGKTSTPDRQHCNFF